MPHKPRKAEEVKLATAAPHSMPAVEALSFLRDTRGLTTWTARDMAASLKISASDAKHVIAILELQGYVKPAGRDEWMTTMAGEEVSGSKPPRFTRERVETALFLLKRRISEVNRDSRTPYKITAVCCVRRFLE